MRPGVDGMQVYLTHEADVTLVRPIGTLDVHSFPELRDTLLKCAVEQPTAVIVLMDGLQVDQNQLYSVFVQAWMRAADWPGVPILLVARDRALYHRVSALPAARFVPVHTSVRKAVKAAGVPPRRRRAETTLPPMNGSSPLARQFVAKTCGEWDVRWMTYDAASVATELVENTLQHTDSEPVLRLELRKHLLTVAVSDESPRPAVLTERRADGRLSLGLLVVAQCARVWGCTPTLSGGKVTWAVLPTDARRYELPGEL